MNNSLLPKIFLVASFFLMLVDPVNARQTLVTGGLDTGFDFDDREYRNDVGEDDLQNDSQYRRFVIKPLVVIESRSEKNSFKIQYVPSLKYDMDEQDNYLGHDLRLALNGYLTERVYLQLSNNFISSDDPREGSEELTEGESTDNSVVQDPEQQAISDDAGRHRYWSNDLNVGGSYFYQDDSQLYLGYLYRVLRNDDTGIDGYENYDKHQASATLGHRFNSRWKTNLSGQYVKGIFDLPDFEEDDVEEVEEELVDAEPQLTEQSSNDLQEYYLTLSTEANHFEHNPLYVEYRYIAAEYEEALRDDSVIHEATLSWQHQFSSDHMLLLGGGPSFEETENHDAIWGYNTIIDYNIGFERGLFNLKFEKKFDQDNFTGVNERGTIDYYQLESDIQYELFKDLRLRLFASYRYEDRRDIDEDAEIDPVEEGESIIVPLIGYHKDRYRAGVGASYLFLANYSANLRYSYTELDSDRSWEDYKDHRVELNLSYKNEFFKW